METVFINKMVNADLNHVEDRAAKIEEFSLELQRAYILGKIDQKQMICLFLTYLTSLNV